jgi:hypothetical protein
MKLKLIVAFGVIAALTVSAEAQKKPTKADAEKVVKLISADKAKTKIYCDMAKLGDEAQQAEEKKDTKKAEEIAKKVDDMGKQLGPEYVALMDGMQNLDEKEAEAVGASLESLDKLCGK